MSKILQKNHLPCQQLGKIQLDWEDYQVPEKKLCGIAPTWQAKGPEFNIQGEKVKDYQETSIATGILNLPSPIHFNEPL